MKTRGYLIIELIILFVVFPISLVLDYPILWKVSFGMGGFLYLLWVYFGVEKQRWVLRKSIKWKVFWRPALTIFGLIVVTTIGYVWWKDPHQLFYVPIHKPLLYLFILAVYTLLSVLPQGFIYRSFFFERYAILFPKKTLLMLVNAAVFALAHLFFRNTLVLIITFVGGALFAWTYLKFKSGLLVNIQHAIYGNWLFTVGMGQILGFPGMEN